MQPDELRRTEEFPRRFRGYSREDVDEYIDSLLEQYSELYLENRELVLRLQDYTQREEELRQKEAAGEEKLRDAGVRAQEIVRRAEDDGQRTTAAARKMGDELLARAQAASEAEEARLLRLQVSVEAFHRNMCTRYRAEMEELTAIADDLEVPHTGESEPSEPAPEQKTPAQAVLFEDEVAPAGTEPAPAVFRSEFDRVYGNRNYVKEVQRTAPPRKP